jgi:5-methylcytosine-specific restriction endonuclease McrA
MRTRRRGRSSPDEPVGAGETLLEAVVSTSAPVPCSRLREMALRPAERPPARLRPRLAPATCHGPRAGSLPVHGCGEPAQQVDHIVPKHRGGTDDSSNLTSLCRWCHDKKTGREGRLSQ